MAPLDAPTGYEEVCPTATGLPHGRAHGRAPPTVNLDVPGMATSPSRQLNRFPALRAPEVNPLTEATPNLNDQNIFPQ